MADFLTLQIIDEVTASLRAKLSVAPKIGLILGSGLGGLAESVSNAVVLPYEQIPHWPVSTVLGHSGRLVAGELAGQAVVVMQGRAHYYEGYEMSQIGLPIRVMRRLGVETLVVTNAAGGINREYEPGDLMLISDHLNLIGMAGANPLRGPNLDEFGPRFPDMSQVYDRQYRQIARQTARELGLTLHEGVYFCLSGPTFETPADLRFLQMIGADAVGMSTVPEVIVARHSGMRVLGVSAISNKASLDGEATTTHEEVFEAGKVLAPRLEGLVRGFLERL